MLSWACLFSMTMTFIKMLDSEIPIVMVVFMRLLFGIFAFMPLMLKEGFSNLKTTRLPLHLFRVVLTCAALGSTYYAYAHLPMAFAASIGFTAPLISTVLALLILNEKVGFKKWIAIIIGYCGVLVMVKPEGGIWSFAVFIALFANVFAGGVRIVIKKLSTTDSSIQIMMYNNIFSLLLVGSIVVFYWHVPSLYDIFLLFLIGGFGTFSQYSYIKALEYGDISLCAPFEYSRLLFAVPIGLVFFAEIPTQWTIIGSLIIVSCNIFLTYYEIRQSRIKTSA